jgi:methionyl-tRNA synthetase
MAPSFMTTPSFITTPIYYINAQPHIGHAYTTMLADAIARSRRLLGEDVFFLTGTDEHGQKVERAAQHAGVETSLFADRVAAAFRQMTADVGASNDDFIRTTEPRHYAAAQEIWRRVLRAGDLYKGDYEGWYCTVDEIFVPETQLVGGACPTCGGKVERLKEESYYFRLSKYQQPLLDWYRDHPDVVQPAFRLNEVRTFVAGGLQDLSVSRTSFRWGVPVPDDPAHVMYVWFDALTNYLTALGFGSTDPEAEARIARFWPTVTHFIGKEIVRQHAIYWPAFLMSAGLPPPRRIIAHGFWLMGGAKMSKSLGNVARYQDYVEAFGLDALRYFVMREMPIGQDASFSDDAILARYNADQANDLGNLASRAVTMIHRYRGGRVPAGEGAGEALDARLVEAGGKTIAAVTGAFEQVQVNVALQEVWSFVGLVNKYIVEREPWTLAKDPDRSALLDRTLYGAADALRVIAALVEPVMPDAAGRIRSMLGVAPEPWTGLRMGTLASGTVLAPAEALFPRIERTVEELRTMTTGREGPLAGSAPEPQAPAPAPAQAPEDGRVSIDDFMRVELRVAKILEAEPVPKSRKLLKLRVDAGDGGRTLVAGIAGSYTPEQLVGRSVVVVANLQPARLMGIESNGMVLAASPEGGGPILLAVDESVPPGTRVR